MNTFEISIYDRAQEVKSSTDNAIQGLFALASMPSHDCVANATHEFSAREDGYRMTMRAVVKIPKGADITHSYTEPLDPVLQRRSLLQVGKFFMCKCSRLVVTLLYLQMKISLVFQSFYPDVRILQN